MLPGLFSHDGREKYPPAALNWVLAVPNFIHTYRATRYTCHTARTSYKKEEIYMEFVEALRVLYPRYKYKIIPVVVGALGAIPKSLKQSLTELFKNYSEQRISNQIRQDHSW